MDEDIWYRLEDVHYAGGGGYDERGEPIRGEGYVDVIVHTYRVKHTPKGVWLLGAGRYGRPDRFVRRDANKRFACPTMEEAKESFIARKKRQASIYEARLKSAHKAIDLVIGPFAKSFEKFFVSDALCD